MMKFKINLLNTTMNLNPIPYRNYNFVNMLLDYNARLFEKIKTNHCQLWCDKNLF